MSGEWKKCPNGHYYTEDKCPYCPVDYSSVTEINIIEREGVASRMSTIIPICKHCGRPLRKGIPRPPQGTIISSIQDIHDRIVPWNYKWDDKCEHCGYDYNIMLKTQGAGCRDRVTSIWVKEELYDNYDVCDASCNHKTGLSGVRISTDKGGLFLSVKELRQLINVLSNSPILEQFDFRRTIVIMDLFIHCKICNYEPNNQHRQHL